MQTSTAFAAITVFVGVLGCHGSSTVSPDLSLVDSGPTADAAYVPDADIDANLPSSDLTFGIDAAAPFDFGDVVDSDASYNIEFTVKNGAQTTTGVLTLAFTGANPDEFVLDEPETDCNDDVELLPEGTCSVWVHFHPLTDGAKSATLVISDSFGRTTNVVLRGTGVTSP